MFCSFFSCVVLRMGKTKVVVGHQLIMTSGFVALVDSIRVNGFRFASVTLLV